MGELVEVTGETVVEQARLTRGASIQQIKERDFELLRENYGRSLRVLREIFGVNFPEGDFQEKTREFLEYYKENLFNEIVHNAPDFLGDITILKSPAHLAASKSMALDEIKNQSGLLDVEIGNTNYVFANFAGLPSTSFTLLDRKHENTTVYQIDPKNGYVVPLDIADTPILHGGLLDKLDEPVSGNYKDIDALKVYYYKDNIFSLEDFSKFFAAYCACFFEKPQEALGFFAKYNFIFQSRFFKQIWTDEDLMKRYVSTEKDIGVLKKMRDLMRKSKIMPPFCPEIQFRDKVEARVKKEGRPITNGENAVSHKALSRNLALAEAVPAVKNCFISREQAAYCLGWKDLVNPNSEQQTVLYNAMGPDVGTVLLSTNATTVFGVDFSPPSLDKTRDYLAAWDKVDTDAISLPPESDFYIDKYRDEGIIAPTHETSERELRQTLRSRAERGFWDVSEMMTWSIDRCLIIELKKLGIHQSDIRVTNANGRVQLDFPWAFPGEESKPRRITYVADATYDIIDNPEKYSLPLLDGYYEKSAEAGRWTGMDKNDLQDIQRFIKPEGYVLIGRGYGNETEERELEASNRAALGVKFRQLNIDKAYTEIVHQKLQGKYASKYGWELYGARKITA